MTAERKGSNFFPIWCLEMWGLGPVMWGHLGKKHCMPSFVFSSIQDWQSFMVMKVLHACKYSHGQIPGARVFWFVNKI